MDEEAQRAHRARLAPYVEPHLARRRDGVKHPVHDFLFTYYSFSPSKLMTWEPGWPASGSSALLAKQHEVLVLFQGPHGYVSPAWYPPEQFVPTWNHVTAHCWGTPEILSDEENFRVLGELVDHFEQVMPEPVSLEVDEQAARGMAKGTVGIRIRVTRFDARAKLSQNKAPEVVERIVAGLRGDGPYASPALADEMARAHGLEAR